MNKIFKVIWSKSKECYVVVSEIANNYSAKKAVLTSVFCCVGGNWWCSSCYGGDFTVGANRQRFY